MRASPALLKRSAWKVPHVVRLPISEARAKGVPIRTDKRSCTILPSFVGLTFEVHNGRAYQPLVINKDMVGWKLGDFVFTRVPSVYKKK